MQVEYALLAEAATTSIEGRLCIVNGGIEEYAARAVPTFSPMLMLVFKLRIEASECETAHTLHVAFTDGAGQPMRDPYLHQFSTRRHPQYPTHHVYYPGIIQYPLVEFAVEGLYRFTIFVDDTEMKTVEMGVRVVQPQEVAQR